MPNNGNDDKVLSDALDIIDFIAREQKLPDGANRDLLKKLENFGIFYRPQNQNGKVLLIQSSKEACYYYKKWGKNPITKILFPIFCRDSYQEIEWIRKRIV